MQRCFYFAKADFPRFFELMRSFGPVHAPVAVSSASSSFMPVSGVDQINMQALRTILPPKKLFYPPQEPLVSFSEAGFEQTAPDTAPQVLFGVHPCDLAGLAILDKIFVAHPGDAHYMSRRQSTLVVGLSCLPDPNCFCTSMGCGGAPARGFDLFLTDLDKGYFVQVGTPAGLSLLSPAYEYIRPAKTEQTDQYKEFWQKREECFVSGFQGDNLPAIMDVESDHPMWQELGSRCLSCGNCVMVCPTCYCFDMVDTLSLSGTCGERCRQWDGCQFNGFAKVAGDFNFRATAVERYKFWFRHKLHGFEDPYGDKTCVGCGRCRVSCPADIDRIVEMVPRLAGK